jgi:hypothetical protein
MLKMVWRARSILMDQDVCQKKKFISIFGLLTMTVDGGNVVSSAMCELRPVPVPGTSTGPLAMAGIHALRPGCWLTAAAYSARAHHATVDR